MTGRQVVDREEPPKQTHSGSLIAKAVGALLVFLPAVLMGSAIAVLFVTSSRSDRVRVASELRDAPILAGLAFLGWVVVMAVLLSVFAIRTLLLIRRDRPLRRDPNRTPTRLGWIWIAAALVFGAVLGCVVLSASGSTTRIDGFRRSFLFALTASVFALAAVAPVSRLHRVVSSPSSPRSPSLRAGLGVLAVGVLVGGISTAVRASAEPVNTAFEDLAYSDEATEPVTEDHEQCLSPEIAVLVSEPWATELMVDGDPSSLVVAGAIEKCIGLLEHQSFAIERVASLTDPVLNAPAYQDCVAETLNVETYSRFLDSVIESSEPQTHPAWHCVRITDLNEFDERDVDAVLAALDSADPDHGYAVVPDTGIHVLLRNPEESVTFTVSPPTWEGFGVLFPGSPIATFSVSHDRNAMTPEDRGAVDVILTVAVPEMTGPERAEVVVAFHDEGLSTPVGTRYQVCRDPLTSDESERAIVVVTLNTLHCDQLFR